MEQDINNKIKLNINLAINIFLFSIGSIKRCFQEVELCSKWAIIEVIIVIPSSIAGRERD